MWPDDYDKRFFLSWNLLMEQLWMLVEERLFNARGFAQEHMGAYVPQLVPSGRLFIIKWKCADTMVHTLLWGERNGIAWHHLSTSIPAWVDRVSFLHDTSMSLKHTFPWEAKSPGSALELEQGFQGNHSGNDKQRPASIRQHPFWQLTAASKWLNNIGKAFLLTFKEFNVVGCWRADEI